MVFERLPAVTLGLDVEPAFNCRCRQGIAHQVETIGHEAVRFVHAWMLTIVDGGHEQNRESRLEAVWYEGREGGRSFYL